MKNEKDRNCYFLDCLTFYDGKDYYQFFGICKGILSEEKRGECLKKAKSDLWYVFIPHNCTKTLAEMNAKERFYSGMAAHTIDQITSSQNQWTIRCT